MGSRRGERKSATEAQRHGEKEAKRQRNFEIDTKMIYRGDAESAKEELNLGF
jgi:hypothetical protein